MTAIVVTGISGTGRSTALRCLRHTIAVEPLLRAAATAEIDTREPLGVVVDRLAALAGRRPVSGGCRTNVGDGASKQEVAVLP